MSNDPAAPARADATAVPAQAALDLFLISVLILFLELACIRWFPAHVLFLTFFTNTVLLACFLGMSLGCLASRQPRDYLRWTPWLLVLAIVLRPQKAWMRPASIGIVPPACENSHLMSSSLPKLPLSSRLVTVRVVSCGTSSTAGNAPTPSWAQHAATSGCT